jgi:hypothetical protein
MKPVLRFGVATAVLAGALLPWDSARWGPPAPSAELPRVRPALEWLRANAPAGATTDFRTTPSHSVLAHWHYGHWLTALAGQANVACPFGNAPQHQRGLQRARDIFGAKTEAEAATACRALGIRFVLSTDSFLPATLLDLYGKVYGTEPCFASALQSETPPSAHFTLLQEWTDASVGARPLRTRLFELVPAPQP